MAHGFTLRRVPRCAAQKLSVWQLAPGLLFCVFFRLLQVLEERIANARSPAPNRHHSIPGLPKPRAAVVAECPRRGGRDSVPAHSNYSYSAYSCSTTVVVVLLLPSASSRVGSCLRFCLMRDLVSLLLCLLALVGTFALRATVEPFPLVLAEDGPGVAAATFWMGACARIAAHVNHHHCEPRSSLEREPSRQRES
jgi:hypothetical protein